MQIPGISHSPRLIGRYRKVISVLLKYGFEDIVAHPPLNKLIPTSEKLIPLREGRSVFSYSRAQRIRMAMEELGTTYIKFGQILSNRPDILPDDFIAEMQKFQDHVPEVSWEEIKEVLEADYDGPLTGYFQKIEEKPVASASMAQVHRAFLLDGTEVALKIQRPGISDTIESDIAILRNLAEIIEERAPETRAFQPIALVDMFESSILKELKFTYEANNLKRFTKNFAGNKDIYIPKLYPKFSTPRVICIEFINGIKITDLDKLKEIGANPSDIALRGINLYFEQVFKHGFFHADPHPGNLFIMPDKRICFIDYGMMGTVIEADKELLGDMMLSLARKDVQALMHLLQKLSDDPTVQDSNELEYDVISFFEEYYNTSLDEIEGGDVIDGLNRMFFHYNIRIPANLLLLLKALVIIEGVGLHLDPNYNIIQNMEPYVEDLLKRKYDPRRLFSSGPHLLESMTYLFSGLPKDMRGIIKKIQDGRIHIEIEPKGLDEAYRKLDIYTNRITFSIVLAAMLIGSSIVVLSKIPPMVYDIPVIGVIGFLLSVVFAIRLLLSIWRHGKF